MLVGAAAGLSMAFVGCEKDKPVPQEESYTITFEDAPEAVVAVDKYGSNYYSKTAAGKQVTTGYFAKVSDETYVQFPVNYNASWDPTQPWSYEFSNGGSAVSYFTEKETGDYKNQMSVYGNGGYAGSKHFAVCTGYSDSKKDPSNTFTHCTKIYITDKTGYTAVEKDKPVKGNAKVGKFNSVWVSNTTYGYLTMRDGNAFAKSLEKEKGWFKVVFLALDENGKLIPDRRVEHYLANFDDTKKEESGLDNKIRDTWSKVDLTPLGEGVSALLINFEGSDTGAYGLNTPTYVAIDNLEVTVK